MSAYNVYPGVSIDYLVCSACGAATFTWLARPFACPACGSDDFAEGVETDSESELESLVIICYSEDEIQAQLLEEQCEDNKREAGDQSAVVTDDARKRKRSENENQDIGRVSCT
ncbi:hypothetical protein GMOD_00006487 [Pyrenophora seminiperda CCB06]|uniref:Uncharacterized protein n=1 Tax=Pyrenophora seminiperda CCB06 TaxID=1302712 RepID=A0A3M7M5J3_9PLEO|nr:hypothetical protein GMOD_00006487 [Pyrenophora seminiperda CCB06]